MTRFNSPIPACCAPDSICQGNPAEQSSILLKATLLLYGSSTCGSTRAGATHALLVQDNGLGRLGVCLSLPKEPTGTVRKRKEQRLIARNVLRGLRGPWRGPPICPSSRYMLVRDDGQRAGQWGAARTSHVRVFGPDSTHSHRLASTDSRPMIQCYQQIALQASDQVSCSAANCHTP